MAAASRTSEYQGVLGSSIDQRAFIDAIHVKIRDGKVANRPVYTVVGVTLEGERDASAFRPRPLNELLRERLRGPPFAALRPRATV